MSLTLPETAPTRPSYEPELALLRSLVSGVLHTASDPSLGRGPDAVAAVGWAAGLGLRVTAQPTGHGATGLFEDTLLLRTWALVGRSPPRRTRSCSGRSAEAAATSGSSPGSPCSSTRRRSCTSGGCTSGG